MKALLLFFSVFLFFACANKQEVKREYQLLSSVHEGYLAQLQPLFEIQWELKEMTEDKSQQPDLLQKTKQLYQLESSIYDEATRITVEIEALKEKLLRACKVYFERRRNQQLEFPNNLTEEKHFWTNPVINIEANYDKELNAIRLHLKKFRFNALKDICKFNTGRMEGKKFSFNDPNILSFEEPKMCWIKLEKATNHVMLDDTYAFQQFYFDVSSKNIFLDEQVHELLSEQSLLSALAILTDAQMRIAKGTQILCKTIRYYTGCCEPFDIDKIFVNVDGPEAVMEGDSVVLRLFYSFYNSYKVPILKVDKYSANLQIEEKEGMAYIRFKAAENQNLTGTLTILNKSGVPKTMEWKKTIKVLKK